MRSDLKRANADGLKRMVKARNGGMIACVSCHQLRIIAGKMSGYLVKWNVSKKVTH